MSPVFTQDFVPDTQSWSSAFVPVQSATGSVETGRKVRASFTALGLAVSLGAAGALAPSSEAADSWQLAALPAVSGDVEPLPSFGSSRPEGAAASYHTVLDGETIWDIAQQHGVEIDDIKAVNGIAEDQVIQAGQVLKVPAVVASHMQTAVVLETPQALEGSVAVDAVSELQETEASASDLELDTLKASDASATASYDLTAFLTPQQPEAPTQEEIAVSLEAQDAMPSAVDSESMAAVAAEPEPTWPDTALESLPASEQTADKAEILAKIPAVAASPVELYTLSDETLVHQVDAGETIWSIARNYGIDPKVLQRANQLSDPDVIVAGEALTIPDERSLVIQSGTEWLNERSIEDESSLAMATPSIQPEEAQTADKSSESVVLEPSSALVDPAEEPGTINAISDPFVEDLLSEVAEASRSSLSTTFTSTAQYSTEIAEVFDADADNVEQPISIADSTSEVAVNPQFSDERDATLAELEEGSVLAEEELLAAAPLGSEVYSPIIENPVGQVVTPEMPILPSEDEYLPEAPNRFDGYMWPAQGVLTSGYGWRWGRMHRGVDIAGPVGTPIYAAGAGVVVTSGWNSGGYGNMVDVRHPDGSLTRYAHNSRLMVSPGQQVRQGQQIAEMGSTGFSTGPHLHFEIHIPSQGAVNPIALLPSR
ncbi:MAG: peptidoglycan DD-metalloendopeptidase family protein [Cyanobacteria bacterium J06626_4]